MNIFYLHNDTMTCAQQHVDKHCVKMILEYAQLLSTAHRVLDGTLTVGVSKTGRKQTRYVLSHDRDTLLYNATHINHPSAKWARHSDSNYRWLYQLFVELCAEYTYRYGKVHLTDSKLSKVLKNPPKNIPSGEFCAPWRAMPDQFKVDDTMESYRNYYRGAKMNMFSWKKRDVPAWIGA